MTMTHQIVMPLGYLDQYKHTFKVTCSCGWESLQMWDHDRRGHYKEAHTRANHEFNQHVRAMNLTNIVEGMLSRHNYKPHELTLLFNNSYENRYLVVCKPCDFFSEQAIHVPSLRIERGAVKLRKLFRLHTLDLAVAREPIRPRNIKPKYAHWFNENPSPDQRWM